MPEVTTRSPCFTSAVPATYSIRSVCALADDEPLRARALDHRARRGVAIDQHLHARRARARQDRRGRRRRPAKCTAMSRATPSRLPLSIVMSRNSAVGRAGDDLRGHGVDAGALPQLEQLAEAFGALRLRALFLQPHLQRLQLALERLVLGLCVAQRDIAGPHVRARCRRCSSSRAGPRRTTPKVTT